MDTLKAARTEIDRIDREMARLFAQRMHQVAAIAAQKRAAGAPVRDAAREAEVLRNGLGALDNAGLHHYYEEFCRTVMALAREYQRELAGAGRPDEDADEDNR